MIKKAIAFGSVVLVVLFAGSASAALLTYRGQATEAQTAGHRMKITFDVRKRHGEPRRVEDLVLRDTVFFCSNGQHAIGGTVDWNRSHPDGVRVDGDGVFVFRYDEEATGEKFKVKGEINGRRASGLWNGSYGNQVVECTTRGRVDWRAHSVD
jgi:hypothetical protein